MRKIIISITLVILLMLGSVEVFALNQTNSNNANIAPLPNGDGLMQRLRNRIYDMLGICQGGINLTTITGILNFDGTNFFIGDVEIHFGPIWFIESAESNADYDDDGVKELVYDELQGLVGTEITVEGHMQSSGWMSVFIINGEIYREIGQPIWSSQHEWHWRNRNGPKGP